MLCVENRYLGYPLTYKYSNVLIPEIKSFITVTTDSRVSKYVLNLFDVLNNFNLTCRQNNSVSYLNAQYLNEIVVIGHEQNTDFYGH